MQPDLEKKILSMVEFLRKTEKDISDIEDALAELRINIATSKMALSNIINK